MFLSTLDDFFPYLNLQTICLFRDVFKTCKKEDNFMRIICHFGSIFFILSFFVWQQQKICLQWKNFLKQLRYFKLSPQSVTKLEKLAKFNRPCCIICIFITRPLNYTFVKWDKSFFKLSQIKAPRQFCPQYFLCYLQTPKLI